MTGAALDLWLYDVLVAHVVERRTGKFQLRYTEAALDRWPLGRPLLSVSMPLTPSTHPPRVVGPFLEGLLPEGEARVLLEEEYEVRRGDVVGLLAEIGRDCAGAVVAVPAGQLPPARTETIDPLHSGELARLVRALPERPLGDDAQVRISLAGQQGKLVLTRTPDGAWARPLGGTPSTHILKPADQRYPGAAANEVLCLRLARELGLTDVDSQLLEIDGIPLVVVERYDRQIRASGVERLHQEDTCQALAVNVGPRGAGKYEAGGGPSFAGVARLLDVHNGDPDQTGTLAEVATFTVAIGNADAHGKNLSLLLPDNDPLRLAPLYDLMSTVQYPTVAGPRGSVAVSTELAMFVNDTRDIDAVDVGKLEAEVTRWHFADDGDERIHGLLDRFDQALDDAAVGVVDVSDRLVEQLRGRAARLRRGATAGE
jgi:serine/threonine-protein kinase HipA